MTLVVIHIIVNIMEGKINVKLKMVCTKTLFSQPIKRVVLVVEGYIRMHRPRHQCHQADLLVSHLRYHCTKHRWRHLQQGGCLIYQAQPQQPFGEKFLINIALISQAGMMNTALNTVVSGMN